MSDPTQLHVPSRPVRFVTAASLFDGHDAAINIMRRFLQRQGCEVIHLGHNRSVDEVVAAAVEEDVQGVAVSSYQGGHVEYFGYLVERLAAAGRGDVGVYGGGGGVIVAEEREQLHRAGVARIFSPEDGQRLGLAAMVNTMVAACDRQLPMLAGDPADLVADSGGVALARTITAIEDGRLDGAALDRLRHQAGSSPARVLGITGTGGSGKSSLTDELVRRARLDREDKLRIAVVAVDPTRRRGGGALLGDRIRMNALEPGRTYFRSLATRGATTEVPACLPDVIAALKVAGFDLVVVETPGIGQGDAAIAPLADVSLYVMTPEFGAASQLEKIDMLDFADVVAINKFERRGGSDALRDVRRVLARSGDHPGVAHEDLPVFGTVASRFNDDGVTALYHELSGRLGLRASGEGRLPAVAGRTSTLGAAVVPPDRARYLADIAAIVRSYHRRTDEQAAIARRLQQLDAVTAMLAEPAGTPAPAAGTSAVANTAAAADTAAAAAKTAAAPAPAPAAAADTAGTAANTAPANTGGANTDAAGTGVEAGTGDTFHRLRVLRERSADGLDAETRRLLDEWPALSEAYRGVTLDQDGRSTALTRTSLSGTEVPRVSLPRTTDHGDLVRYLREEHLPGRFPYTAGVFPFRREGEDPARMFAGEGDAFRTNRRFKMLAEGQPATRLSTAFDSVTLYGFDPDERPDIYGKVGNSGVSIATVEDMKVLYGGFDLCDPSTSVSMTINGPAPTILAMYFATAVDQQVERFEAEHGRPPDLSERAELEEWTYRTVRGTVQADILKEDQGQNTCIFSTEFSLRVMGDIAEWFSAHRVRGFYSVSISGYHIAEAGANPISQLAFTLANGFTYVESYLARGMTVDDFAPNLSFFFSNGMDPEYTVLGRVARRIWAVAMRDRYGANARSQKLKYHIQTSGRSLHAQEMAFNDIRTTLQALCAYYDNANSLHTNAYDEAVTTPSEESVRRALAIQLVIAREWGLAANENPLQGSYAVEDLTDLVEAAVLAELDAISERGGVLGAMETGYQRGRIQDESMLYETRKHDGSLPIVGVNTFLPTHPPETVTTIPLARSTDDEKKGQLARLQAFKAAHAGERPAALERLADVALAGGNVFEVLVDAVRCCTLGEITDALFAVGGRYRRSV